MQLDNLATSGGQAVEALFQSPELFEGTHGALWGDVFDEGVERFEVLQQVDADDAVAARAIYQMIAGNLEENGSGVFVGVSVGILEDFGVHLLQDVADVSSGDPAFDEAPDGSFVDEDFLRKPQLFVHGRRVAPRARGGLVRRRGERGCCGSNSDFPGGIIGEGGLARCRGIGE